MADEGDDSADAIDALVGVQAAHERAHKSGERAAEQFVKLLGTLHGGLGLATAAWLQRIFELSGQIVITPLSWYLAITLLFVALGLITLVLTAIIDQRSAFHFSNSIGYNAQRLVLAKGRIQIARLPRGDDRSAQELSSAAGDAELRRNIVVVDAKAKRLNTISVWTGVGSWVCLIAAFATLAIGIIVTINHIAN
jgi:hypothetical protein